MPVHTFVTLPAAAVLLALGVTASHAQSSPPRAADPAPCSRATATDIVEAIAASQAVFDASWQAAAPGTARTTAFQTKPEPVNPLLPRDPKAPPPAPAIQGFIRADSVGCAYFPGDGDLAVWFVGTGVRFHEAGGWSGPLPQGLLMGTRVRRVDGVVKAIADPNAPTVVLPDAVLRKPDAGEIDALPPLPAAKSAKKR